MEWVRENIVNIVEFINNELSKGRSMASIEREEFGVSERVIHKRLIRLNYKRKIINTDLKVILQVILQLKRLHKIIKKQRKLHLI